MKRKLALLLVAALSVSVLFCACDKDGNTDDTSKNSESTQKPSDTSATGDINDLYKQGEYEKMNLADFVDLGDYSNLLTLKEEDYVVTDAEVQAEINEYLKDNGTTKEVKDRAVKDGDVVKIDYIGRMNGIKFLNGSATGQSLTIGSKTFIDDFEEQLIGAKIGDKVNVTVTFPDEYPSEPEFAGKEAVFEVTIKGISEVVPAEFTDALVKKITSSQYTTTTEFTAFIRNQLEVEKSTAILDEFLSELVKISTYALDDKIDDMYEESVKYYEEYAKSYKMTLGELAAAIGMESEEKFLSVLKEDAKTIVQFTATIYAYAQENNFTLSDEVTLAKATELAKMYGYTDVAKFLGKYAADEVRSEIFNQEIAKIIIENLK